METLLYELVRERNAKETYPFVAIHNSNNTLRKEADAWHTKCEELERQIVEQQESLERFAAAAGGGIFSNSGNDASENKADKHDEKIVELHYAESAALKNERRMREELERLQSHVKSQDEELRDTSRDRNELKDLCSTQEKNISALKKESEQQSRALEHLTTQLSDSDQRANLAEQQCTGLKNTIRILQDEGNNLKKQNHDLEKRMIEEKNRLSSEVNSLNDMVAELLQSLKKQDEKRKSWFGFTSSENTTEAIPIEAKKKSEIQSSEMSGQDSSRDNVENINEIPVPESIVMPSDPKQVIQAHRHEAACVRNPRRCNTAGTKLLATGGNFDGTVKIWNATDGSMLATFRGGSSNSIVSCDVTNTLVAGGGNDKTCRVWDIKTQRMVHQLVGHTNQITCVRFLIGGQGIVTASKDRQIKVWDISKQTYRQTTNIVLNSTANSIDMANNSNTLVSGHTNGSLRFWDIITGAKSAEIADVHRSAITSVQFHPLDDSQVLTNSMDSVLKIIDVRTHEVIREFRHKDFQTSYSWSSSVFSPDGAYVSSGSSSNGFIFVWSAKDGQLVRMLEGGHQNTGVCGIAWGRGGDNGFQVASADKSGKLILWS